VCGMCSWASSQIPWFWHCSLWRACQASGHPGVGYSQEAKADNRAQV